MEEIEPHIGLIDCDQIIYATAVQGDERQDEPDSYILHTAKKMLEKRQRETLELYPSITKWILVISDKMNFRKVKDPEYKGQRPPKPLCFPLVREYFVNKGAISRPYLEADDVTAMLHEHYGDHSVLVDQDKDLDQVTGHRVVPSLSRGGKVIREHTAKYIEEPEAHYSFYVQMLTGDTSDNINGVWGKPTGRKKTAEQILAGASTEYELWLKVLDAYLVEYDNNVAEAMYHITLNANHLYMRRFPCDYWLPPKPPEEENKDELD